MSASDPEEPTEFTDAERVTNATGNSLKRGGVVLACAAAFGSAIFLVKKYVGNGVNFFYFFSQQVYG